MDGDVVKRTQTTDLTRALAEQASAVSYDALPEPVWVWARQCVLDYYGVALAGADDPLSTILLDELTEAGGAAQASIIGHKARLPALSAALVNGAIGHALDYDDVNLAMPGHASVAILPA
jgi:2-methylcitrate dehydratase PrpD